MKYNLTSLREALSVANDQPAFGICGFSHPVCPVELKREVLDMFVKSAQTKLDATAETAPEHGKGAHMNQNGGYAEWREVDQETMERYEVQTIVAALQARTANSNDELKATFA